jgi:hypothetical protein
MPVELALDKQYIPQQHADQDELSTIKHGAAPVPEVNHNNLQLGNPTPQMHMETSMITRASCKTKPTRKMIESQSLRRQQLVLYSVLWGVFHDGGYDIQTELEDPIVFTASNNPDVLYLDEAMSAKDSDQF